MKFGRLILIVSAIVCAGILQGRLSSQVFAEEPRVPAPTAESAAAGQQITAQPTVSSEPNGPPPKITFEQTVNDLGQIAPSTHHDCEFKFKNEGVGTLVINDISKTCGCTVFTLEKKEYAPGEEGTLKVQYSADAGPGVRTRHLYVFSNDPANQRVELTIKAFIAQKVAFKPDQLEYKLRGDNANIAELTVWSLDDQPFEITKFESTGGAVTANFDPGQKAPKFVLQTRLDPNKVETSTSGRIEITVTHPECSSITVPFTVLPRFRVDPPAINVLNAEPGQTSQKELWILNNYDEDFEISSVVSAEKIIKVVSKEEIGNRYKLGIEIVPPEVKRSTRMFTDTLSITMKDGEKINVTCRGFFKR